MADFNTILLISAVLLVGSVLASKASGRFGVPSLLAFVAVGMLAGSDGPGGIHFDDPAAAQRIGILALAFILFAGGMQTPWKEVRPVIGRSVALATVGIAVSAAIVGVVLHLAAGYSILEGMLLGSIVAATDAAAVFGLLRGQGLSLREDVQALVELESGSNDPMAVFLTIGLTSAITSPNFSFVRLVPTFFVEMAVGLGVGVMVGYAGVVAMRRLKLGQEALYTVVSLAVALAAYSLPGVLHGNGFLGVYVAGLVYGNAHYHRRRGLIRFHDAIGWLMQVGMFLMLGLLVYPSQLLKVALVGTLVACVLMFVARPAAVALALAPFRPKRPVIALLSWAGLRGAVPIVLATYPLLAGVPRASEIFNVVFFVVLVSALVQGTTLPALAGKLGLCRADEPHALESSVLPTRAPMPVASGETV